MKDLIGKIRSNQEVAENIFKMEVSLNQALDIQPGQFGNLSVPGHYLRRPLSIYDYDPEQASVYFIYKIIGQGTKDLSQLSVGSDLSLLFPLGQGFNIQILKTIKAKNISLVGGGVGVPPLYYLAKSLLKEGYKADIVLGFSKKSEVFSEAEFRALGLEVKVTTDDGSYGDKGFVTDALNKHFPQTDYVFTCGPKPMLKAIYNLDIPNGQYSFEERMACGFGACMGCSIKINGDTAYKRICLEGPVLQKEEILW